MLMSSVHRLVQYIRSPALLGLYSILKQLAFRGRERFMSLVFNQLDCVRHWRYGWRRTTLTIEVNSQVKKCALLMIFPLIPIIILFFVLSWYRPEGVSWQELGSGLDVDLSSSRWFVIPFVCLICGIGAMIHFLFACLYAQPCGAFSFHVYDVHAFYVRHCHDDNVLLLFVFGTHDHHLLFADWFSHERSRVKSDQALLVTGAGG